MTASPPTTRRAVPFMGELKTAGIGDGPHATAKGLRHGYGMYAIGCGVR